jgi:hypothetical protein
VIGILNAPLAGRPGSVRCKALVVRRIFHTTLAALLDLGVRSRIHSSCFLTLSFGGFAAAFFRPGRHAGVLVLRFRGRRASKSQPPNMVESLDRLKIAYHNEWISVCVTAKTNMQPINFINEYVI